MSPHFVYHSLFLFSLLVDYFVAVHLLVLSLRTFGAFLLGLDCKHYWKGGRLEEKQHKDMIIAQHMFTFAHSLAHSTYLFYFQCFSYSWWLLKGAQLRSTIKRWWLKREGEKGDEMRNGRCWVTRKRDSWAKSESNETRLSLHFQSFLILPSFPFLLTFLQMVANLNCLLL